MLMKKQVNPKRFTKFTNSRAIFKSVKYAIPVSLHPAIVVISDLPVPVP
jgi:hypothetical protein